MSVHLAAVVEHRRRALGWSQAQLAQRAGVSQATVSRLEGGETDPPFSTVAAVFAALGVSLADAAPASDAESDSA